MATVTVSPKFQVVIPQDVREQMQIRPGQKLRAMAWGKGIVLLPELGISGLRGLSRDLPNDFVRDKSDRADG
jgi:AbrB family looped-hinge helix DNA binding protein